MTPESDTPATIASYHLPKSGLMLNGSHLTRRNDTGGLVAEFELAEISSIEFRNYREPGMRIFAIGSTAVAVGLVAAFHASIVAWIAAIAIGMISGFLWLGSHQHAVVLVVNKHKLEIPILDPKEDGHAFVLMLQKAHRKISRY